MLWHASCLTVVLPEATGGKMIFRSIGFSIFMMVKILSPSLAHAGEGDLLSALKANSKSPVAQVPWITTEKVEFKRDLPLVGGDPFGPQYVLLKDGKVTGMDKITNSDVNDFLCLFMFGTLKFYSFFDDLEPLPVSKGETFKVLGVFEDSASKDKQSLRIQTVVLANDQNRQYLMQLGCEAVNTATGKESPIENQVAQKLISEALFK